LYTAAVRMMHMTLTDRAQDIEILTEWLSGWCVP